MSTRRRWLRRAFVAVAIVMGLWAIDRAWLAMSARIARGPVVESSKGARFIAAQNDRIVIGLDPTHDPLNGTYEIIGVDPATSKRSEIKKGAGSLGGVGFDADWIYWSLRPSAATDGRSGTYVMPFRGGPIRKVSDEVVGSIGLAKKHAYFFTPGGDGDLFTGPAGGGLERRLTQPAEERRLVDGGGKPHRTLRHIVVNDAYAMWILEERVPLPDGQPDAPWEVPCPLEQIRHGENKIERLPSPCPCPGWMLAAADGAYLGCPRREGPNDTITGTRVFLLPNDGAAAREIATFDFSVEPVLRDRWFYREGTVLANEVIYRCLVSGGPDEKVVARGGKPFAFAGGRIWYNHPDGVASLPLRD